MADEQKPVKALAENAHRHSASVASSPHTLDDQAFVDAVSEFIAAEPTSRPQATLRVHSAGRKFYDCHHAFEFLIGCEIAQRLLEDPSLIGIARVKLEEQLAGVPSHRDAYNLWSKLLELPVDEVARQLSLNDEEGDYIRQTSPSFIALPEDVRWRLVDESKKLTPFKVTLEDPHRSFVEKIVAPDGIADVDDEFPPSRDMPRGAKFDD